jgi:hypothetical protein
MSVFPNDEEKHNSKKERTNDDLQRENGDAETAIDGIRPQRRDRTAGATRQSLSSSHSASIGVLQCHLVSEGTARERRVVSAAVSDSVINGARDRSFHKPMERKSTASRYGGRASTAITNLKYRYS